MSEENLTLYSRIVQAAKTHEEWQEINPVLKCGEKIYVVTSQQPWTLSCKIGDGKRAYIELPFYSLMQGEDVKVNALHGTAGGLRTRAGALGFRIVEMSSHNDTSTNNNQLYYDEGWYKIDPNGLPLEEFTNLISDADAEEENQILYSLFMKASGDRVGIVTKVEYVDGNQYIKLTVSPYQHPNKWYQLTDAEKQLCYDESYIFFDKFPDIGNIPVADCAVAFGCNSSALAHSSFTSGANNMSLGKMSFTSGNQTTAGYCAMATGIYSKAIGYHSHAQNYRTQALGMDSSASGRDTIASGVRSDAGGHKTVASGENSFTRGSYVAVTKNAGTPQETTDIYPTTASGKNSLAGGAGTEAIGTNSIAFGTAVVDSKTKVVTPLQAKGANSVALGQATVAEGDCSIATGSACTTQSNYSEVGGLSNTIGPKAPYSIVKGYNNHTVHKGVALFGGDHNSFNDFQFIAGRFSATPTKTSYALIGIGTKDDKRKNGLEVHTDGTVAVGAPGVEDNEIVTVKQLKEFSPAGQGGKQYIIDQADNTMFYLTLKGSSYTQVTDFEVSIQYQVYRGPTGAAPIIETFHIISGWSGIESEPYEQEEGYPSFYYQPNITIANKSYNEQHMSITALGKQSESGFGYDTNTNHPIVLKFEQIGDYLSNFAPSAKITVTCKHGDPDSIIFNETIDQLQLPTDKIPIADYSPQKAVASLQSAIGGVESLLTKINEGGIQ